MSRLQTASGIVTITFPPNWTARAFGLPFLAVGLWLGSYLVMGLFDLVTGASDLASAFGLLVLTVVTAAFLVPGWLLVFTSASVQIDRLTGTVIETRGFLIFARRTEHPLAAFTAIEALRDVARERQSRRSRATWDTRLVGADGRRQVLTGMHDDPESALRFGRELSGLTGLPLHDLTEGRPRDVEEDGGETESEGART